MAQKAFLRIKTEEAHLHYDHHLYISMGSDGVSLECKECGTSLDYATKVGRRR